MLESKIQKQTIDYLLSIGCKVINLKAATKSGNADLVICYRGLYIEFEMKQLKKDATKLQKIKGRETAKAGGLWYVVHSVDEAQEIMLQINSLFDVED